MRGDNQVKGFERDAIVNIEIEENPYVEIVKENLQEWSIGKCYKVGK